MNQEFLNSIESKYPLGKLIYGKVATLPGSYLRSPTSADRPTVIILSKGDRP
ncbi:hypothetical protein [Microcoleus anatoxicus]|uniref:Uncharacterized protein n=1 Tax=Microcoleus anatoxicus PTRS2 TaxID=2705321 RepID=A0ABU8YMW7_9CYAN